MVDIAIDEFLSWARYLFWAELRRRDWDRFIADNEAESATPEWLALTCYWAASLYVVVEGWESLRLSDPIIQALMKRPNSKDMLRRLRNGTFHYQPSTISPKLTDLFGSDPDAPLWLITVHDEFCRFFREWIDRFQGTDAQKVEYCENIKAIAGWIPPSPQEPKIQHLQQLQEEAGTILARSDRDSESRNGLQLAISHCDEAIEKSRELVRRNRLERLWKLGVLTGPKDLQ
jgi:hypothetical protein